MTNWRETLADSEKKRVTGQKNNKAASALLWDGAKEAITEWHADSSNDVSAEGLYNEVMSALGGRHRKGDASKIKTVALAVKGHGLNLSDYPNLSKAYKEARRLTTTVKAEAAEDEAAEAAVKELSKADIDAATTPEMAAALVLSRGLDEAARLLLDALGSTNDAAHRSFMRAVSQEIAGRVKPKTTPKPKAGPKAGAVEATGGVKKEAAIKTATTKTKPTKAKPAPVKKAESVKATPASASKGDPNKKALPPKKAVPAKAVPAKAVPAKAVPAKAVPAKAVPAKKATPVKKAVPVRR